jgi:hypothetical protein
MSRSRFARRLFVTYLLGAFFSMAAAAQSNLFTTTALNSVGAGPTAMAYGDFNGDGRVDVAVADFNGGSVSILLGTGDGNFQPTVDYPVGSNVAAIAVGDFNRDGHLDLAVTTEAINGTVSIFLGRGDGTFFLSAGYLAGAYPSAIGVYDFNGDGNVDLAVASLGENLSTSPGFVTILLGRSDGTFQPQPTIYTVGSLANAIAVGDFNGDGKADLAVGTDGTRPSTSSQVSILLGDGTGGFEPGATLSAPGGAVRSIAILDFNGDSKLDLATLNSSNTLSIFLGNGDGTFANPLSSAVGNGAISVVAADLNGDGRIDVAVANSTDNTVSVLLGNGDGTFQTQITYPVGKVPSGVALVDFNGDGKFDLAVANNGDNTVQILLGAGDGTFRVYSYTIGPNAVSIISGDFNRDGIPDLAIGRNDSWTGSIAVLMGDGRDGFTTLPSFIAGGLLGPAYPGPPGTLVSADFDQDGIPDLAVLCDGAGDNGSSVSFFKGAGDGTFRAINELPFFGPIPAMVLADINGDGIQDLFFSLSPNSYAIPTFPDPQGAFSANYVDFPGPEAGPAIAGDFNGDGKTDFLILSAGGGIPTTMLGDGTGAFQIVTNSAIDQASAALTADFNGDGLSDMAAARTDEFQIRLSNGDGTFGDDLQFCCEFQGLAARDLNGDGIPDVLFLSGTTPLLKVNLGQADGSFVDSGTAIPVAQGFSVVAVADFDGNGSPDVALLQPSTNTVQILLNKNSFQPTTTTLSQSGTKVVVGQSFTLSAAVTGKQGTPTGNLIFKQAGVPQTTVTLSAGAAQATATAPSTSGQFGYTALYTGNGTFSGSLSQRLLVSVSAASSSTVVSSSKKNSKLGQSVTLTAGVSPQYSGVPTGTVAFYADGQPIGTGAMSNGQASVNISTLTQGSHKIEADYSGDASFTTSVGLFTQKVGTASSTVTLASSMNPATYGQPVTLTATVTDSEGIPPTGTVVFSEGGTIYGSVTLNAGVAQLTLPQLLVGKHTITAQYSGDASDDSSKATFTETIQGASSSTAISSSLNPSNYGQAVIFTATVTSTGGVPDGTVTFKNGNQALGTVTLSGGQAQLSVTTIDAGASTIKAVYNGNSTFATSQNSLQQVVVAAPTTLTLAASPNPASSGQSVTFTATVNCSTAVPTGTVTFKDGKTTLGTATVVNGQAQFTTSTLAIGTHSMTATFKGSKDFAGSSSPTLQEVIN